MKTWNLVLFTILGITLGFNAPQRCGKDLDCDRDWECDNGFCTDTKLVTIPGDCKDPNEDWLDCALTCNPTCANPDPVCNEDCSHHGCFCRKNYVRDSNGQCLRKSDCPSKPRAFTTSFTTTSRPWRTTRPSSRDDRCVFDSDCPSGFSCGRGFCAPLPQMSQTPRTSFGGFASSHSLSSSSTGELGSLGSIFSGETFQRKSGERIDPNQLDHSLIAFFFTNSWSPAGQLFYKEFRKFYDDLENLGKRLEVIFIGIEDQDRQQYDELVNQFPKSWIALPYHYEKTRELMRRFSVKGLPHVPLYKNGRILNEDIREDIHRYEFKADTAQQVYEKWERF